MNAMLFSFREKPGYIALLSILMVSAVAAMTIIILFVTSLNTSLNSGDVEEGTVARALADGCIETALQWITNQRSTSNSCSPGVSPCNSKWEVQDRGTCTIQAVYHAGTAGADTIWRVRTTGSGITNTVKKYVEVEAYRVETADPMTGSAVIIQSWNECVNFLQPVTSDCSTE